MDSDVPFEMQHNPCRDTIAGWLWYCGEHDSHGNADSMEEAEYVANAHTDFFTYSEDTPPECHLIITKVEEGSDG